MSGLTQRQPLQPATAERFGRSSPQGAAGQANPAMGVILGRLCSSVSKVFRTNTGRRLARKLILDLKARAENYRWAKKLGKKYSRERRD